LVRENILWELLELDNLVVDLLDRTRAAERTQSSQERIHQLVIGGEIAGHIEGLLYCKIGMV
jgi:hypothetical protein